MDSLRETDEFRRELEAAKLESLAEFAAGAGHEINNPVATIVGYVQQLLSHETDPDRRHALTTIGGQAYRIRDMIGDVMLFARPPQPQPVPVDLADVLGEVVEKLAAEAELHGIRLEIESSLDRPLLADPTQLRIVLSALLRNALEASSSGGSVLCESSVDLAGREEFARIRIRDQGKGLSAAEREHLFDPFYSGRQAGRGLGFGLSKAWRIVTGHGGQICVATPPEGGAEFTVLWKLAPPPT